MFTGKAGRAIDGALDHILRQRKQTAKQEAERASVEWLLWYVVDGSRVLIDAPLSDRLHWLSEVDAALHVAGLERPAAEEVTEPTA
ncbi:hypothetical protein ABIQ69_11455 [Agromyces sp. G08B096]|uniref:Uncharacterized protein n=1 Tax=Agromyces sp. G08B096 TaxID=3156399 RepID=A0AAU7W430_9MICO